MISKETFVRTIEQIMEINEKMNEVNKAIRALDPEFGGFYPFKLFEPLLSLLLEIFQDEEREWLEYFIFELDFLRDADKYSITYADGTPIDVSSWDKVYDFLLKEIEENEKEKEKEKQ